MLEYSRAEAARNLGLMPQILSRWLKDAEDVFGHAFRGNYGGQSDSGSNHNSMNVVYAVTKQVPPVRG